MATTFSSAARLLLFLLVLLSPAFTFAQDCLQPLGLGKGTEFTYQVTDKGRNQGTIHNKVTQQVIDEERNFITTFKSVRMGKKNRTETAEEFNIFCTGDTVYLDAMLLLREQALKAFDGKDFDFFPVNIAYPQQMQVGHVLPNGELGVRVRSANTSITKMIMVAQNRKVVAREAITTPAGTFDCFKITYQYVFEIDALGMDIKHTYDVEEYFSLEHGLIKCQFTTKSGKKAKGLELISKRTPAQALQN